MNSSEKRLTLDERIKRDMMFSAVRNGDLNKFKTLLADTKVVLDPNIRDEDGDTMLYVASTQGYIKIVEELLQLDGIDINAGNLVGKTPLMVAAMNGYIIIVEKLFEAGADPDVTDKYGQTALIWSSTRAHIVIIKELLQPKVDPTTMTMLTRGANPNLFTEEGNVALYFTFIHNRLDVIEELLNAGADPWIPANNGQTPMNRIRRQTELGIKGYEKWENYFPSLHILSVRSIKNNKIDIAGLPSVVYLT